MESISFSMFTSMILPQPADFRKYKNEFNSLNFIDIQLKLGVMIQHMLCALTDRTRFCLEIMPVIKLQSKQRTGIWENFMLSCQKRF